MNKISIIIPVYNVDKYIEECFDNLISQDYENFEAILIDDGSYDYSSAICEKYTRIDSRFSLYHSYNKGIGYARNIGLEMMTGEYCFFLDPDDVLEKDSLSYLVDLIEKTDSDLALAVTRQFKGPYKKADLYELIECVYCGHKDICEEVLFDKNDLKPLERKQEPSKVTYEFFSTLYRSENLKRNDIKFLPISYGEDTYVCFKSLLTSNKVVTSNKIVYSHRYNPTSTTHQYHPNYLKETKEYYKYYLRLFEEYAKDYYERGKEALDGQYLRRCCSAIEREIFLSPNYIRKNDVINTIQIIRNDEIFNKLFTWKNIKYLGNGNMKYVLRLLKIQFYFPIAIFITIKKK